MLVSCINLKKKLERYLRVNLLGPGPRLMKKRIYRAAVSQRLRNTDLHKTPVHALKGSRRYYVRVGTAENLRAVLPYPIKFTCTFEVSKVLTVRNAALWGTAV
jgi:hypothetical protein